jgi:hypothetical protein
MKSTIKNWWCKLLLAGAMAAVFIPPPARADVIIDWNARSEEIAAQKQVRPVNHSWHGDAPRRHVWAVNAIEAISALN